MSGIFFLLPLAIGLGLVFAWLFARAANQGQFDDLDDPPERMLRED